jgi:hypothetical protein
VNRNSSLSAIERLESLKAALTAALGTGLTFAILTVIHLLWSAPLQFPLLAIKGTIACFSGFLFGVTYRYIIRSDRNLQLSTGAVFAFGLIRGLAMVQDQVLSPTQWVDIMITITENIILFTTPAILLNIAFQQDWIKRFGS